MGYNIYQSQIRGPFAAGTNLMNLIHADAGPGYENAKVWHLGITAEVDSEFSIMGKLVKIGKTGMYEIGNTKITDFSTAQNLDVNTIIDYVIVK